MNKTNRHQTIQPVDSERTMTVVNSDQTAWQIVSSYRAEAVSTICQLMWQLMERPVAPEMTDDDLQAAALAAEVTAVRIRRYQKALEHNNESRDAVMEEA